MLEEAGDVVVDHGDLPGFRRRPDPVHPDRQNIDAVVRVVRDTADAVESIRGFDELPLVLGGDCTVTVGVVTGMRRAETATALLYFDGGPDLYTPGRAGYGNIDAMGLAHMLAIPGADTSLASVGGTIPLLRPEAVVTYGDAIPEGVGDLEEVLTEQLELRRIPATRVHEDVGSAAAAAVDAVEHAGNEFVVHFDVDVLGHMHMPLANMPNPDSPPLGLTIDEAVASLQVFSSSPNFAGLVLTEVNPANAPDQSTLVTYAEMVASGLRSNS